MQDNIDILKIRESLHKIPELAFCEWNTLSFIINTIKDCKHIKKEYLPQGTFDKFKDLIGLEKKEIYIEKDKLIDVPCLKVTIDFNKKGKKLAIRTDMDALPINESHTKGHYPFDHDFASDNCCMHACAHDGHMALALKTILFIDKNYEIFKDKSAFASISFIFQGAEEGCRGAKVILDSNFLDDIDVLYCYHLGMKLPSNYIATNPSKFLSTFKFKLDIFGKKAHAGYPDKGINALAALANIIAKGLSYLDPQKGFYINFSQVLVPGASNIIPDFATCLGEVRSDQQKKAIELYLKLQDLIKKETQAISCSYNFIKKGEAIGIKNSTYLVNILNQSAQDIGFLIQNNFEFNASEDASLLIKKVQDNGGLAAHFVIGANIKAEHHQNNFDFDTSVLDKAFELIVNLITKKVEK